MKALLLCREMDIVKRPLDDETSNAVAVSKRQKVDPKIPAVCTRCICIYFNMAISLFMWCFNFSMILVDCCCWTGKLKPTKEFFIYCIFAWLFSTASKSATCKFSNSYIDPSI